MLTFLNLPPHPQNVPSLSLEFLDLPFTFCPNRNFLAVTQGSHLGLTAPQFSGAPHHLLKTLAFPWMKTSFILERALEPAYLSDQTSQTPSLIQVFKILDRNLDPISSSFIYSSLWLQQFLLL